MRTSHTAIRRRIADEKSRLTDEQLFASPQFAAYLTDIRSEERRVGKECRL